MAFRRPSAFLSFSDCKLLPIRQSYRQDRDRLSPRRHRPRVRGDARCRDPRLLALYFNMSTMQPADQLRAFDAALKFIDTQMDPSDLMAVMTFEGGAVRVLQAFPGDRG